MVILGMMLPIIIVRWLSVMKSVAAVPVIAGSGVADVAFVLMSPTLVASLLVPDVGLTVT
jgi:hypothetical protein